MVEWKKKKKKGLMDESALKAEERDRYKEQKEEEEHNGREVKRERPNKDPGHVITVFWNKILFVQRKKNK